MDLGDVYASAALVRLRSSRKLFVSEKIANASCLIMPDSKTAPNAGYLFIGVRPAQQVVEKQVARTLYERVSIIISLTVRTTDIASDRVGVARMNRSREDQERLTIYQAKEEIIRVLHESDDLLKETVTLLRQNEAGKLYWPCASPLIYQSVSPRGVQPVSGDHFGSATNDVETRNDSGLLMEITFTGGLRYRQLS
jgi:hypothetical protein